MEEPTQSVLISQKRKKKTRLQDGKNQARDCIYFERKEERRKEGNKSHLPGQVSRKKTTLVGKRPKSWEAPWAGKASRTSILIKGGYKQQKGTFWDSGA